MEEVRMRGERDRMEKSRDRDRVGIEKSGYYG